MSEELKPCPFCGVEAKYQSFDNGRDFTHEVYCANKACTYLISDKKDKVSAYKAWNIRSNADLIKEQAKNLSLSKKIVELKREIDGLNAELYRLNA